MCFKSKVREFRIYLPQRSREGLQHKDSQVRMIGIMTVKKAFGRQATLGFLSCVWGMGIALLAPSASASTDPPRRSETGIASWYNQAGSQTSSGVRFNPQSNMAAHKTLPFGTVARVTNLDNGRSEIVKITDRGPFTGHRIIDLTPSTAKALGVGDHGLMRVSVTPLSFPSPGEGKLVEVSQGPELHPRHIVALKPAVICAIDMAAALKRSGL